VGPWGPRVQMAVRQRFPAMGAWVRPQALCL
jgi:hypothetical protein